MIITRVGMDVISIDEDNMNNEMLINIPRIHIIKFKFFSPNETKINKVLSLFPKTNRFIVEDNIRIYNYILKKTSKKYYVENIKGIDLITFFRKNNKILFNYTNLSIYEKQFFLIDNNFNDILKNVEVIIIDKDIFNEKKNILYNWNGNVIVIDKKKL